MHYVISSMRLTALLRPSAVWLCGCLSICVCCAWVRFWLLVFYVHTVAHALCAVLQEELAEYYRLIAALEVSAQANQPSFCTRKAVCSSCV